MADAGGWVETNIKLEGFSRIDFDRKQVRKGMRIVGRDVQKEARRLIARRAISNPGDFPGRRTGRMMRSIKVKVSRPGFLVRIAPYKTPEMQFFYPAVLHYGSKTNNLQPRENYMTEALDRRNASVRSVLANTLQKSLIPRR